VIRRKIEEERQKQLELAKELVYLTSPEDHPLLEYRETPELLRRACSYRIPYFSAYVTCFRFSHRCSPKGTPSSKLRSGLPFSTVSLLTIKDSFSHQPNPLEVGEVLTQAREDAEKLHRFSTLQYEGLLQCRRVVRSAEPAIPENRRDVLHKEVEWMASFMKEERERKKAEIKKTAKVSR
jgi:hypothetical protein